MVVRTNTFARAVSISAVCAAFAATLTLNIAASAQTKCVFDVALMATDQVGAPSLAGWELAGYWDVAGEGVDVNRKGSGSMGLFVKKTSDPAACLQTLCLKASDQADPGTPPGYARLGMWDADNGGSRGVCGVNVAGAPRQVTTGSWMLGLYTRYSRDSGAKVIQDIQLTASDAATAATPPPGYEVMGNWDVDRGGAFGSVNKSTGSYMMTLSVLFGPAPGPSGPTFVKTPSDAAPATPATNVTGVKGTTTLTPAVLSASQYQPVVDGNNVTHIVFDGNGLAGLQQISRTQWQEISPNEDPTFMFTERSRDKQSVSLVDSSRNVYLDVNLTTKQVKCCTSDTSKNFVLYTVKNYESGYKPEVTQLRTKRLAYYRLVLRTSDSYNLRVWGTGQVGSDQVVDDNATWLLVPTGNTDEYWILNKGAKNGRGQALSQPAGQAKFAQWDFVPDDKRQRFKLQPTDSGFFRLIVQDSGNAISTRWHEAAFAWGVTPNDKQQEFKLVQRGSIDEKDTLPGYVFWNYDNARVKSYFGDYSKRVPNPNLLNIKKMLFVNASDRTVVPAVHHWGCAGAPWRSGVPQCWYATLGPDEQATFEVSDYVKNGAQIWEIIGSVAAITAAVAITVACVGLCTSATAAAIGPAAGSFAGALVSLQLGSGLASLALGVVDFTVLAWAIPQAAMSGVELTKADEVNVSGFMGDFGVTKETLPIIRANLGPYSFGARNGVFKQGTDGFYLEETNGKQQIISMFYADGTCLFVIQ